MIRLPLLTRRGLMRTGMAFGAASLLPRAGWSATPVKVAGIHGSPVENAWNLVLHDALMKAKAEGAIEYVFSEGVAPTDYPRAMREYAEQGAQLIIGETFPVERQAREVAAELSRAESVVGAARGAGAAARPVTLRSIPAAAQPIVPLSRMRGPVALAA